MTTSFDGLLETESPFVKVHCLYLLVPPSPSLLTQAAMKNLQKRKIGFSHTTQANPGTVRKHLSLYEIYIYCSADDAFIQNNVLVCLQT
jgi:hypothetical protein